MSLNWLDLFNHADQYLNSTAVLFNPTGELYLTPEMCFI